MEPIYRSSDVSCMYMVFVIDRCSACEHATGHKDGRATLVASYCCCIKRPQDFRPSVSKVTGKAALVCNDDDDDERDGAMSAVAPRQK